MMKYMPVTFPIPQFFIAVVVIVVLTGSWPVVAQPQTRGQDWFTVHMVMAKNRPDVPQGPIDVMHQNGGCTVSTWDPRGTTTYSSASNLLNLRDAHRFATGNRQTVAIIDSGVQTSHIHHLLVGTDFVTGGDGHTDCDGQGTLIAGIIAGNNLNSVAPRANILPIRWNSAAYSPQFQNGYSQSMRLNHAIDTLAGAIVFAADHGASVIVVSQFLCVPVYRTPDIMLLKQAIHYATEVKNTVIIAAAGDIHAMTSSGNCEGNSKLDYQQSWVKDPIQRYLTSRRQIVPLTTVAVPAWSPEVLSVAAVDGHGSMAAYSLTGPWIGVAAPGSHIVSYSNSQRMGLSNSFPNTTAGYDTLKSSAYAAAFVGGTVALIRERFPELTPAEVIHRLEYSAQGNSAGANTVIGYGVIDPVAALTWEIPEKSRESHHFVYSLAQEKSSFVDHHKLAKILVLLSFIVAILVMVIYRILQWMNNVSYFKHHYYSDQYDDLGAATFISSADSLLKTSQK